MNRWRTGVGPGTGGGPTPPPDPALTDAFLRLDSALREVEEGVSCVPLLDTAPDADVAGRWGRTRSRVDPALGAYLTATSEPTGRPVDVVGLRRGLESALEEVDAFRRAHGAELSRARAVAAALPGRAMRAVDAALAARGELVALDPATRAYRAPARSLAELDDRAARLDAARTQGTLVDLAAACRELEEAVASARTAAAEAPGTPDRARRALASVRTRAEAAEFRRAQLTELHGELLRDFALGNHADLGGNDHAARAHLDRVGELLREAGTADPGTALDDVLDLVAALRAELAAADGLIDAVRDRLDLLRGVAADPSRGDEGARFRLRDARHLVRSRGLEAEWGQALDTQERRLDAARAALAHRHPDYLAYIREAERVEGFVGDIVDRLRRGA